MPLNAHWQRIGALGVLGILGLMPAAARAIECQRVGGNPLIQVIPAAVLDTDPSLPIGTVIGRIDSITVPPQQVNCVANSNRYNILSTYTYANVWDARNRWYPTSMPGVAMRLYRNNLQVVGASVPITTYQFAGRYTTDVGTYRVEYIRTGPITGGVFDTRFNVGAGPGGFLNNNPIVFYITAPTTVPPEAKPPTCSVGPGSQQVSLGNIVSSAFGALNAEAGAARATLSFVCSGATDGATRTIRLTLTDATMPANRSSNLSLTAASTARGLAVRMRNDGTPISYGPDSSAAGNPGQFLVKAGVGNETVSLPLDVSYVRTGTVTAGSANATATFTVRYE